MAAPISGGSGDASSISAVQYRNKCTLDVVRWKVRGFREREGQAVQPTLMREDLSLYLDTFPHNLYLNHDIYPSVEP